MDTVNDRVLDIMGGVLGRLEDKLEAGWGSREYAREEAARRLTDALEGRPIAMWEDIPPADGPWEERVEPYITDVEWLALEAAERNERLAGPIFSDRDLHRLWKIGALGCPPDEPDILRYRGELLLKRHRKMCGPLTPEEIPRFLAEFVKK